MHRPTNAEVAVLIVEDDDTIGRHLTSGLRSHGYRTTWCRTGSSALIEARLNPFDVALLDLGLPDMDGIDVARDLRRDLPELLIVILTARGEDIDVVIGLDVGADDYLVKPVTLSVLLARLRAHLRRHDPPSDDASESNHVVGALTVDRASRRCFLSGFEVRLRSKEFDLLAELTAHAGTAVRREDLMAAVWDEHWFGSTKTLDVTMAALRSQLNLIAQTIDPSPAGMPVITTLRGHGYRLEAPPTDA